jgi:ABC-type Zn2+ transport system substrate-binding protein/surface adhesin
MPHCCGGCGDDDDDDDEEEEEEEEEEEDNDGCDDSDNDDDDDNEDNRFTSLHSETELFITVIEAIMQMHVAVYIKTKTTVNEMVARPTFS